MDKVDPIEVLREYVNTVFNDEGVSCEEYTRVVMALDGIETQIRGQALRPLRWYTDARDGLCPEAK